MPPSDWQKIETVFQAALDVPTAERSAWLSQHCGEDVELCREVQSLLAAEAEADNFLRTPHLAKVASHLIETAEDYRSQRIGPYKILREIGRGGMGVVYLASRDDEQYSKQVAIKLIKRGMDTDAVLQRFRHERQILANLEHPNIACLLDGGTNDDGLPYFVMEYIEGLPIDDYCDQHGLSTNERLKLFRQICAAVTYAHQNLVIHRDLKPINILVTDEGVPKLLDFGIAKVLRPIMEEAATATVAGLRVLTPEYASPEQLRGEKLTTSTDVYSLGVILYELLTGQRPYQLKEPTPEEWLCAMEGSEPTKPSKVTHNGESINRRQSSGSEARPSSLIQNSKLLRGDLDNIILMALRKEPARRYKSVEQFSEDISRYLEGLPVFAHKDTLAYRASKFVRRNKVGVAAACLVFLTLVGGIVATIWQARKAREQARIANAKSAEAQAALARTEKINRFMQSIFSYANPDWFGRAGGRRDMSVLEAMRDIEKHIEEDFRDDPDLRADVYQQIGDSYRTQSLYEDAERNLRKALRLRLELYGEDSAKVAESMYILSGVRQQQSDFAEHEHLLTQALSIQRRRPNEGNNLPYMMLDYAGLLAGYKNDYAGALALDREALAEFRRRYDESHFMVALTQSELTEDHTNLGDYAQAETSASIVRERFKQQPLVLWNALQSSAFIKIIKGDYQSAEDAIQQMLAQARSQHAKPFMTPAVHFTQAFLAFHQGDYKQAMAYAEQGFAAQQNPYHASYNHVFIMALCLNKLGQVKRAEALLLEEIERMRQSERVFELARLKSVLGESLTAQRRFSEAETNLLEAYETQNARVLPGQYDLVETRRRLAELYRAWGKTDKARMYESEDL
jgi:serine/threonine protein kinase